MILKIITQKSPHFAAEPLTEGSGSIDIHSHHAADLRRLGKGVDDNAQPFLMLKPPHEHNF